MTIADKIDQLGKSVTTGYKMIEDGVTGGYKAIENGAVNGFERVTDKCVELLFAREGETAAEAKARLSRSRSDM